MTQGSTITPFTGQWVMIADFSVCQWVRYSFVFRTEEKSYSWALLSLCGLAPIIHPTILLSFWTQKEDERFRLSPLVSEALLCLSFFLLLSCTEPSSLSSPSLFVSRYPSPHDAEQEKILWWLFHKHADIIFVGFLGFSHLGRVLQMTEQRADSIL